LQTFSGRRDKAISMIKRVQVGISACLVGEKVRYDGGHKLEPFLKQSLAEYLEWLPICPEADCGLGVPREPMRLVAGPAGPRLVTMETGQDHTERFQRWVNGMVKQLELDGISGFVLKSRSPSCALRDAPVFQDSGNCQDLPGLFARELMRRFPMLPVEDEENLRNPARRDDFLMRVLAYRER